MSGSNLAVPPGSTDAERDFKEATEIARSLSGFDVAQFGVLEEERGINLGRLKKYPQALSVFLDGL